MKIHLGYTTQYWTFHIIPNIQLYYESHSPLSHGAMFKTGISGLYLSGLWGKWQVTIGIFKNI